MNALEIPDEGEVHVEGERVDPLAPGIDRVRANGYAFQIELNFHFARLGARVKEIPFYFVDRRRGVSKLTWRIGLEALWVAPRLRVARALGLL